MTDLETQKSMIERKSGIQCFFQTTSSRCICRNNIEYKKDAGLHPKEKLMVTVPDYRKYSHLKQYLENSDSRSGEFNGEISNERFKSWILNLLQLSGFKAGAKATEADCGKLYTSRPLLCVFHFRRLDLYWKSETELWPKFGAKPISITDSETEYVSLNLKWCSLKNDNIKGNNSKGNNSNEGKHFIINKKGARTTTTSSRTTLPSLENLEQIASSLIKDYNHECYVKADYRNQQLVLQRAIPFQAVVGPVGSATATIAKRLGIWKCHMQAGGMVLEAPFKGCFLSSK